MIFIVTWKRRESTCRTTMVEVTQHPVRYVMLASVGGSGGKSPSYLQHLPQVCSGRFRNLERGVQPRVARKAHPKIFGLPRQLPVMFMKSEATPGLVKRLEISKELIRECVTVPVCCCMPLLHNHLMDSCSCVRKYILLAAKCTPLPPLNPPLLCHARWGIP